MKRYSVLIPAYNAESYINECVESVMHQLDVRHEDILNAVEVIIADDGSTDHTGDVCDKLSEKYRNVRVFHKKNEGLLLTRRFLVGKASAEYMLFLDADDKWEGSMLKTLNACIETNKHPDIITFGFHQWSGGTYLPYRQAQTSLVCDAANMKAAWEKLLCSDNYNSVCLKAIKRSILQDICLEKSLENIRRGEDKLQMIACLEKAHSIVFIPDPLYDYRIDNQSMTRSFNPEYFSEILTVDAVAQKKIKQHLEGKEQYYAKWANHLIDKYYDYIAGAATSGLPNKEIKEWLTGIKKHPTILTALKHSCGFKGRLKALLIQLGLYDVLLSYYRRKNSCSM